MQISTSIARIHPYFILVDLFPEERPWYCDSLELLQGRVRFSALNRIHNLQYLHVSTLVWFPSSLCLSSPLSWRSLPREERIDASELLLAAIGGFIAKDIYAFLPFNCAP